MVSASKASPGPDAPTTGVELLTQVKALADKGQLLDPGMVLRVLPGDQLVTKIGEPTLPGSLERVCNPGVQKAFRNTRMSFASWFRNLPTGIPHLAYSASGPFGRAGVMGDPSGSYLRMDEEYCADLLHLPDEATATLRFDSLPGFSCLSMDEVSSVMPLIDDHATDGGGIYSYSPPAQRDYGVRVTFYFGRSRCLAGFTAEQSQKWGTRYLQAQLAFRQCTDAADHGFCASHPPFGWVDGDIQDIMLESSAKQCKGFGLWYQQARLPDPTLTRPPINRATPCDGK